MFSNSQDSDSRRAFLASRERPFGKDMLFDDCEVGEELGEEEPSPTALEKLANACWTCFVMDECWVEVGDWSMSNFFF